MISTLFAYDGWQFVSLVAGEIRDPQRNLPRSIILGVLIVIVVYVSANLAYIFVLGQPRIAASERVAADAMSAMVGPAGRDGITLAILCSTFGALSANMLAGPRVFFAMGATACCSRSWRESIRATRPRSSRSGRSQSGPVVLTLTGGYEHLITMSGFANWIFFTMVVLSVIVLRRTHPEWNASVPGRGLSLHGDRVRAGLVGVRRQYPGGVAAKLAHRPRAAPAGRAVLPRVEASPRVTPRSPFT